MANHSVSVPSGRTVIYGGVGPPLPAWLSAINPGEWGEIASSTLSTSGVGWAGTNPGGSGYQTVVGAWGGGVLNTVGVYRSGAFVAGTFLVLFGGGHGDYGGNELYAFGPLESDAPAWSRITDPTIPAPNNVARLGGYPVSRHTYDTLVYLPTTNQMLCFGSPGYYVAGGTFNVADIFDFDTDPGASNPWSTADTDFPAYNGGGVGTINLVSGYDPATGKAWGIGKGNGQVIGAYDVASGTWSSTAINNPDLPSNSKAGLSPADSLLVFLNSSGSPLAVDLRSTPTLFSPTTTGTGPGAGGVPVDWDADAGRFGVWNKTGKTLYFLTPGTNPYSGGDNWTWTSVTPASGATPATETANGTFGRFRRVASLGGYLLMPTATNPICFYRAA